MNDPELTRSMADLADLAPAPSPDLAAHAWSSGRSARRHDRWLLVAAVLALLATLAGVWQVSAPLRAIAPAATREDSGVDGAALPARVYAPDRADRVSPNGSGLETDLALGQVSVATTFGIIETPLVVTAADGEHHLLALPHFMRRDDISTAGLDDPILQVSPDGWSLAYQQVEPRGRTTPMRTALAVVDLRTGAIRTRDLVGPNGRSVVLEQIVFSPDSRRIAWFGDEAAQWDGSAYVQSGPKREVGTLRADLSGTHQWTVRTRGGTAGVAAGNDGRTHLAIGRRLLTFPDADAPPRSRAVLESPVTWSSGVTSADGSRVTFGVADGSTRDGLVTIPTSGSGLVRFSNPTRADALGWVRPLGLAPDGHLVLWTARSTDGSLSWEVNAPAGTVHSSEWAAWVSIATDLADRPLATFPAPRWPLSDEEQVWLVLALLALLGAIGWLVVRVRALRRP